MGLRGVGPLVEAMRTEREHGAERVRPVAVEHGAQQVVRGLRRPVEGHRRPLSRSHPVRAPQVLHARHAGRLEAVGDHRQRPVGGREDGVVVEELQRRDLADKRERDALLPQQAQDKLEVRLVVLDAVVAGTVVALQLVGHELDLVGGEHIGGDFGHDLRDGAPLEDPPPSTVTQQRQRRLNEQPDVELILERPHVFAARRDPVQDPLPCGRAGPARTARPPRRAPRARDRARR